MKGKNLGGTLFIASILLASGYAFTQPDLQKCALIADDKERLACYDSQMREAAATPTPDVTDSPAPDGLEDIDNAVITVVKASHSPFAGWVLTFDNGQSWKQVGTASFVVKAGDSCKITSGVTNSFRLQCGNRTRRIQVVPVD